MHEELRDAFARLKAEYKLSESAAIACWLEFIAERARAAAVE